MQEIVRLPKKICPITNSDCVDLSCGFVAVDEEHYQEGFACPVAEVFRDIAAISVSIMLINKKLKY